jgi:tellurite resistance protein TerC
MLDDPHLFQSPWILLGLLLVGALLIAWLAWLLGRPGTWMPRTEEVESLAWQAIRQVRRIFVVMAAATLAVVGIVLLVLPGPGMLVLAAALALLATEFVWARRWIAGLRRGLGTFGEDARGFFRSGARRPPPD